MRPLLATSLLLAFALAPGAAAQNHNPNHINTQLAPLMRGYHPDTYNSYSWPDVVPAGYRIGGAGVVPDTRMWRVIPAHAWRRAEARQISGIAYAIASSAATPSPNEHAYSFETTLGGTLPRPGGGLDPDFAAPIIRLPEHPVPGAPRQLQRITLTFSPVALTLNDAAIWFRYAGGENEALNANDVGAPSQTLMYSQFAGPVPWPTMGVDEPGRRHIAGGYELFATVLEEGPVCRLESDWGRQGGSGSPPLYGFSLSTYWGPASGRDVGFAVLGGPAHANEWMLAFLNLGAVYPGSFRLGSHVFELDPGDPVLGVFPWVIPLDAQGATRCCLYLHNFFLPPGLLGLALGVEAITVDPTTMTITGTSGAQWIVFHRP